jgi:hypothetical protein
MKKLFLIIVITSLALNVFAQDDEEKEKPSFKENLFTGGSISLAFYNNTFLVGGNPVFGVSPTNWIDLGIVVNYNYTSYRDYSITYEKVRQHVYGAGAFIKVYPIRFLFAQAQIENNFIRQKAFPYFGSTQKFKADAGSFLVGGGYTTGRYGRGGDPFYYLAILVDIGDAVFSPYTDNNGNKIPIVRGGIQIPLFQGKQDRFDNDRGDGRRQPRNY